MLFLPKRVLAFFAGSCRLFRLSAYLRFTLAFFEKFLIFSEMLIVFVAIAGFFVKLLIVLARPGAMLPYFLRSFLQSSMFSFSRYN